MNVSVTGGTGCLGQPLIERLLSQAEIHVKLLVLPNEIRHQKISKRVEIIQGDLNSADALNELCIDSEIVFHLAGKVHTVPKTHADEQNFYRINVEGTKSLISAAKKNNIKRIIFFSTVGVYGKDTNFHGDEKSHCNPMTAYAKSKLIAEELILKSFENGGPEGVVLRFPVVYGPFDRGNVAKMIQAVQKRIFFYFGDGRYLRSMISSRNAAEGAIKAAFEPEAACEVFCLTDGQDYSLKEFTETICRALRINWRPFSIPNTIAKLAGLFGDGIKQITPFNLPIDSEVVSKLSGSLTFSCKKAKQILKYQPSESLLEGLERETEWLRIEKGWK